MFLVTTALEKYWNKEEEILFLGEWCKLYSRRKEWRKLNYKVLSYHWDDRIRLYNDFLYLDGLYEKCLEKLALRLNEIHGVDNSLRYWRIILGPWLFYFIEIFYDRYLSIKCAEESGLITDTWITDCNADLYTPDNFEEFFSEWISDRYNHFLYSYLIKKVGKIPFTIRDNKISFERDKPKKTSERPTKLFLKRYLSHLFSFYRRFIPNFSKRFIFVASYLHLFDQLKLQLCLKQLPSMFLLLTPSIECQKDLNKREEIKFFVGQGDFELILSDFLPYQIPKIYIEGYEDALKQSERSFFKHTTIAKAIYTANAAMSNDLFRFWAAEQVKRGAKLVLSQHGGHHGMGLWSAELKHEISIADKYFTWGWNMEGYKNICPMPSGQLIKCKRSWNIKDDGEILWVLMSIPRYSYWMYSIPIGPQILYYFDEQRRFAEALTKEARSLLLLRPMKADFGWNDKERMKDMIPSIRFDNGEKTLINRLRDCRLCISTYNATTYLETFTANFPTILLWNPKFWELRPEAVQYFDDLRRVGILHFSPESAALKVNEIYKDPLSWWITPDVQSARERFCTHFAMIDKKWRKIWKKEFITISYDN